MRMNPDRLSVMTLPTKDVHVTFHTHSTMPGAFAGMMKVDIIRIVVVVVVVATRDSSVESDPPHFHCCRIVIFAIIILTIIIVIQSGIV